mmetsp:Transcript_13613/g.18634  ORF Transcript_13613/g.18634 Transcript_13613/m.18634 type:complete len:304 (+) Transcript_13613:316-1227(+)
MLAAARSDPRSLLPPKFFNDLDILSTAQGEVVVFSDSSYSFTRSENRIEVLDGAPRGRLFAFSLATQQLQVLLCGLHFPNGLQSFPSQRPQSEIIVAELSRFRVLKVNISSTRFSLDPAHSAENAYFHGTSTCDEFGYLHHALSAQRLDNTNNNTTTNASTDANTIDNSIIRNESEDNYRRFGVTVFMDSVPGIVDNIRWHNNSFYLALGGKSAQPFSLLWTAYQSIVLRDVIGKFVSMQLVEHLLIPYGLVLQVDENGRPQRSLHDPTGGNISWVSHADRHPITGELWLGSHSNAFIGILPQ